MDRPSPRTARPETLPPARGVRQRLATATSATGGWAARLQRHLDAREAVALPRAARPRTEQR